MIVGIPKGLLYHKYYPFYEGFFRGLDCQIVSSPDTNKEILDQGISYAVDEACLPLKIFHGHVSYLRDKVDAIFIPRIMQIRKGEYICPKFCGLPEMIFNSIPDLPKILGQPIQDMSRKELHKWAKSTGKELGFTRGKIGRAFDSAYIDQSNYKPGLDEGEYDLQVGLIGHPYNIYDRFSNMDIVNKLKELGIGLISEESLEEEEIDKEIQGLFKRPFWSFASHSYAFALSAVREKKLDGLIYISSFACGIDSIIIELIKDRIGDFPFLILKIDEHTGEAGLNTRLEAFADMLERRM